MEKMTFYRQEFHEEEGAERLGDTFIEYNENQDAFFYNVALQNFSNRTKEDILKQIANDVEDKIPTFFVQLDEQK